MTALPVPKLRGGRQRLELDLPAVHRPEEQARERRDCQQQTSGQDLPTRQLECLPSRLGRRSHATCGPRMCIRPASNCLQSLPVRDCNRARIGARQRLAQTSLNLGRAIFERSEYGLALRCSHDDAGGLEYPLHDAFLTAGRPKSVCAANSLTSWMKPSAARERDLSFR